MDADVLRLTPPSLPPKRIECRYIISFALEAHILAASLNERSVTRAETFTRGQKVLVVFQL